MPESLTDDQRAEFKEMFELFDSERTGYITSEGMQAVLKQFGHRVDPQEFQKRWNEADVSDRGKLTFEQFLTFLGR